MDNLYRPYREWVQEGRVVRAGEKATHYLTDEQRTQGIAVFHLDQTASVDDCAPVPPDWIYLVPADEYRAARAEAKALRLRPAVRIGRVPTGGASVWCGPNREAIGWLKQRDYQYDPTTHRWTHAEKDAEQVARGWEAVPDYVVRRDWEDSNTPTEAPAI